MIPKEITLEEKVAILVGNANSRVRTLALALVEAGAKVVTATPEDVGGLVEEASGNETAIHAQNLDITSPGEINKLVVQTLAKWHKIDILVNCTNLMLIKPFLEISQAEWSHVMNINLTSAFLWCQAIGKQMLEQKSGKIINVVSGLAQRGLANGAAYCASQSAVQQMTTALALEWAREGIRVNTVGTGWFAEVIQPNPKLERFIPMHRLGAEEELAPLVVYLASDASDFITGTSLFVDGGLMAHG